MKTVKGFELNPAPGYEVEVLVDTKDGQKIGSGETGTVGKGGIGEGYNDTWRAIQQEYFDKYYKDLNGGVLRE